MTRKLTQNLSDKRSREWWNAIEAAARSAPKLDLERRAFPKSDQPKASKPHTSKKG